jgi:hypothetical protein
MNYTIMQLKQKIRRLENDLLRMKKKFPKTKDGVRVFGGEELYHPSYLSTGTFYIGYGVVFTDTYGADDVEDVNVCYKRKP